MSKQKGSSYHAALAAQYLHNSARSLAGMDGQLVQFQEWRKQQGVPDDPIATYLNAITLRHTTGAWPWYEGAVLFKANPQDVATIVLEAINAAGLEAHESGDRNAEETIKAVELTIRAVLGIKPLPANVGGT